MMFLVWRFPLALDRFGDAFDIRDQLAVTMTDWDPRFLTDLLKFNYLDPKVGAQTLFALASLLSFVFNVESAQAVVGLGFCCESVLSFWGA